MKFSSVIAALLIVSSVDAYSVSRSTLRNLGQKSVSISSSNGKCNNGASSLKMEDFGLFKNTKFSFDDEWSGNEVISEAALERRLNKDGLRYKMNRTDKEADEVGPLLNLPGFTVNLPLIGETYLGPPKVESIWEALGFTATSNNEARQKEKLKAIEYARTATKGVRGGPGSSIRKEWLDKYGYPRLVGSGGIFYADQLSTDKQPMGGFNMGKSGSIWPVPEVVKQGQYGGAKGWGMKKAGPAIDGLKAEKKGL